MSGTPFAPRRFQQILFGIALCVCSLAADARAFVAGPPACPAPAGVQAVPALDRLPRPLQEAVAEKLGTPSPIGGPFDATDVVRGPHPHFQRLLFVWHRGDRWVIATEHGGIAYSQPVFSFNYRDGKASFVEQRAPVNRDLCSLAARMLTEPAPGAAH